jgi:hypothetical protein
MLFSGEKREEAKTACMYRAPRARTHTYRQGLLIMEALCKDFFEGV